MPRHYTTKQKVKLKRLRKKGHSPAGARHLVKQEQKTTPVYFKHIKRVSNIERLRKAGLSDKDLKALGYK